MSFSKRLAAGAILAFGILTAFMIVGGALTTPKAQATTTCVCGTDFHCEGLQCVRNSHDDGAPPLL